MTTTDQDGALEALDEAECRRLLRTASIGRLGFTDGALPVVLPVPFAVHDDRILIPAERDSSVVRAMRGAVVAFLVDSYLRDLRTGWGVTVVGPSRVIGAEHDVAVLDGLRLFASPPAPGRCYITLQPGLLRGWRSGSRGG
jgi:hypothetical protein